MNRKPSFSFVAASWVAMFAGTISYNIGLWNAQMQLNEKGLLLHVLMPGHEKVSITKGSLFMHPDR